MLQQPQCPGCGGSFPQPKGWNKKYCPPCIIAAQPCDDCRGNIRLEHRCHGPEYILSPYNEDNALICEAALERRQSQRQPLNVDGSIVHGLRLLREPEPTNTEQTGPPDGKE